MHPEVMAYLGRGKPKSELRVNFNKGFEKMFGELSLQISRNLVTSEYAKVNRIGIDKSKYLKKPPSSIHTLLKLLFSIYQIHDPMMDILPKRLYFLR